MRQKGSRIPISMAPCHVIEGEDFSTSLYLGGGLVPTMPHICSYAEIYFQLGDTVLTIIGL